MAVTVNFQQSNVVVAWTESCESLLDFAEAHGVTISAGCRYGDCGTCLTNIVAGEVEYLHETGVEPDEGACLPCSCRPKTDLTLDC